MFLLQSYVVGSHNYNLTICAENRRADKVSPTLITQARDSACSEYFYITIPTNILSILFQAFVGGVMIRNSLIAERQSLRSSFKDTILLQIVVSVAISTIQQNRYAIFLCQLKDLQFLSL